MVAVNGRQQGTIKSGSPNPVALVTYDNVIAPTAAGQKPLVVQTSSTQQFVVQQSGGTAGTNELQVSTGAAATTYNQLTGTNGNVHLFQSAGTTIAVIGLSAGNGYFQTQTGTNTATLEVNSAASPTRFLGSSGSIFAWNSAANLQSGSPDTGLARNAAGVVEVNNGTPGTLRDLSIRAIAVSAGVQSTLGAAPSPADATADFIWTPSAAGKKFVVDTSSTQPFVVRQSGGTAGTNEVSIYHTGSGTVMSSGPAGALFNIVAASGSVLIGSTVGSYLIQLYVGGNPAVNLTTVGQYAWGVPGTSSDTGLQRVAATVVGPTNGSTSPGWFQNSAGGLALASNFTDVTGTLAATNFSWPVISGRSYKIQGLIRGNNTTGVEGAQFDFSGGTATATSFFIDMESLGVGTVVVGVTSATALNTALTATTFTNGDLRFTGTLVASSSGTIIMRAAEVSHATGTLTILAGSWMTFEDLRAV